MERYVKTITISYIVEQRDTKSYKRTLLHEIVLNWL